MKASVPPKEMSKTPVHDMYFGFPRSAVMVELIKGAYHPSLTRRPSRPNAAGQSGDRMTH
jgi:hypothetical protein